MVFYDNVLNRAKEKEQKEGISYPLKDGKLYTSFKVVYFIALIFSIIMNLFYIMRVLILYAGTPEFSDYSVYFFTVVAGSIIMIALAVISKFNANKIIASVFAGGNLACAGVLSYVFASLLKDDTIKFGLNISFYWRHLAPFLLVTVSSISMALIVIVSYLRTKKAYNRVVEIVYDEYNELSNDDKPDWQEYLKNYKF